MVSHLIQTFSFNSNSIFIFYYDDITVSGVSFYTLKSQDEYKVTSKNVPVTTSQLGPSQQQPTTHLRLWHEREEVGYGVLLKINDFPCYTIATA